MLKTLLEWTVTLLSIIVWVILWLNPLWFRDHLLDFYYKTNFSYFNPFR